MGASESGNKRPRQYWNTRFGVILAVTGSAVGLGNFLRFPGLAAEFEGGVFMVPYFISLLVLGLPIAWAEWTMGRFGGSKGYHSCPGVFRAVRPKKSSAYLGVFGLIVPVMIYMYYVYIESWCLGYAWHYLTGEMSLGKDPAAYGAFLDNFTGMEANGAVFSGGSVLIFLFICIALNLTLIYRGLSGGIEWFCLRAMPLLVVCALIVLVRVLTLGTPNPGLPDQNVLGGLGFMWNLRTDTMGFFEALANPLMWMKASAQIFFSLSVGFGVIITYASYLRRKDDIALSSTTSVAGNQFCEVALGGMITIPAAFIFLGAAQAGGSTFQLGFQTLPLVFEYMPGGRWFGALWFFLLFLAAVTSSISMLQPAIAFLEEGLGLNRKQSTALLGGITLIGTLFVVYFSKNAAALDTIDFWVGTFCIFVLAAIQVYLFGWVFGAERGYRELSSNAHIKIPKIFPFVIRWVAPAYLLVIFVLWAHQNVAGYVKAFQESDVVKYSILLILLCFAMFLIMISYAIKRWERQPAQESAPHE